MLSNMKSNSTSQCSFRLLRRNCVWIKTSNREVLDYHKVYRRQCFFFLRIEESPINSSYPDYFWVFQKLDTFHRVTRRPQKADQKFQTLTAKLNSTMINGDDEGKTISTLHLQLNHWQLNNDEPKTTNHSKPRCWEETCYSMPKIDDILTLVFSSLLATAFTQEKTRDREVGIRVFSHVNATSSNVPKINLRY